MSKHDDERSIHERWAVLRFSIVSRLVASPPEHGALQAELKTLSKKTWPHPATGDPVSFGVSTIERWYYRVKNDPDPMARLRRKVRKDRGRQRGIRPALLEAARRQYEEHPTWQYKLHHDNLAALAKERRELGAVRSYATTRRMMQAAGLTRQRRRGEEGSIAERRQASRETRSFEATHVHGLWHLDFHESSLAVLLPRGERKKPKCLAVIDDRSRLVCHAQWYLHEDTQAICHGFTQAVMKRGLPRRLMHDGGSAMKSEEFQSGLSALSIVSEETLPYSPHQNGKMEHFWEPLENRVCAMLEGVPDLTLELLNRATQAWVECEYNRKIHSETGMTPLDRLLQGPSVGRSCPDVDVLGRAFRAQRTRTLRRSDCTLSLDGVRFEVPSRYRTMREITVRYARWDLRTVTMVDRSTGVDLCRLSPLDRERNADGRRASLQPTTSEPPPPSGIAPLLKALMAEYAACGLLPAYTPLPAREEMSEETGEAIDDDHHDNHDNHDNHDDKESPC